MIRVVTVIPAPLLEEIFCELIERVPDFSVVGKTTDPAELCRLVAQTRAHVVVSLWEDPDQVPEAFVQLIGKFPHILIVNILSDDDTVVLYRREISRCRLPSVGVGLLLSQIRRFCETATSSQVSSGAPVEPSFELSAPIFRLSLN